MSTINSTTDAVSLNTSTEATHTRDPRTPHVVHFAPTVDQSMYCSEFIEDMDYHEAMDSNDELLVADQQRIDRNKEMGNDALKVLASTRTASSF